MKGQIRDQLLFKISEIRSALSKFDKQTLPESSYIIMNGIRQYSELLPIGIRAVKMSTLKEVFGFHKTKLAKISSKLVKQGLIVKISDDFDKRAKYLGLTSKGQQILETEGKNIYTVADTIITKLGDGETIHLMNLLDELSSAIVKSHKINAAEK